MWRAAHLPFAQPGFAQDMHKMAFNGLKRLHLSLLSRGYAIKGLDLIRAIAVVFQPDPRDKTLAARPRQGAPL